MREFLKNWKVGMAETLHLAAVASLASTSTETNTACGGGAGREEEEEEEEETSSVCQHIIRLLWVDEG